MSNKRFNIRCIGCNIIKSDELISKIEYYICNNCINRIDMCLQNKLFIDSGDDNDNLKYFK